MNYSKGDSCVSSGYKNKYSAKSRHLSNDDDDVIVLSDDESMDSNNKCMICYCTLTDSQLARVKALMIDCSDSTNIFNNYCNLLNILMLDTMKWDFQTEPMPFCSSCLAMVKTLAQLSDKMTSIKNQINGILGIIKSEILKSMKKEHRNKGTTGKGNSSRYSEMPTPLEKVDYCRVEAIKDLTPEVVPLLKTEVPCNNSTDESDLVIGNSGSAEQSSSSVSSISHPPKNDAECNKNQNYTVPNQMHFPNRSYKLPVLTHSSRNKRHFLTKDSNQNQFYQNVHEQITQVSSTQRGNSPPHQYQSSKQSYNIVNSSTDVGNNIHEILLDPSQMSQSVGAESEFTLVQYPTLQNYNDHNKSKTNPSATILTEHESDESQSQMLQMEDVADFDPWQFKGNVNSAAAICLKRFRPVEHRDEYVEPPPPDIHIQERDASQYITEITEEDGAGFINLNVQIVENSDRKGTYCCKVCQRRFTTRNSATSHIQAVHLKVKKIQCKFCTKTFFKKFNCVVHINKIHLKGKHTKINPESAVVYLVD